MRHRIGDSAGNEKRGFWETAVVVTTSDEALTKGHVRYLEARLIEITKAAGRVVLDNTQLPDADRRRLPEADRANMEAFLANLKVVLPIVGLDLLKPRPQGSVKVETSASGLTATVSPQVRFEVRHRSGIKAFAVEEEGEFVVLEGSEALKDAGYAHNSYAELKRQLVDDHILETAPDGTKYRFTRPYPFKSPSAAGSVVLDRNTNGRTRWYLAGSKLNYHEWQEGKTAADVEA
ncbi:MAG: GIY-YIG nuclease family protein [Acetobacteraceae bacterium]